MLKRALIILASGYWAAALVVALGCRPSQAEAIQSVTVAAARTQVSGSCRECHQAEYHSWAETDHALANRPVNSKADAAALAGLARLDPHAKVDMVLGHRPLWQPLVAAERGRWQAHELAFDPAKQEWFNVFADEHRRPGEWGHWTGRGMNWNSMCAQCHMTGYRKNYDPGTDIYASTWVEHGVGCIQCHGPTRADHGRKGVAASKQPPFHSDRQKMMQTCASCHARNQVLTDEFQPGDEYSQHYRMVLPVNAATFYPDGQQRDEDFNWTSVQLSRMGHAGVTCFDCHDPHSLKTILPAQDNQLCMQCHAAPGRPLASGVRAVPIDPLSHSHHAAGSPGNQCISCHMPTTTYMQRSPRHDHGWLKPDPLLTKELGIPNACGKCHADKPVEWLIEKSNEWYGSKLDSRQRARARAVAAAQADKPGAAGLLLKELAAEDIPAWRATLLTLLGDCSERDEQKVSEAAREALTAKEPLERSAGITLLGAAPDAANWIRPLLNDPVRLVRLDAQWALSRELPEGAAGRQELEKHLALDLDQPAGLYRVALDQANRGRLREAESNLDRAIEWDPFSAGFRDALGMIRASQGRTSEAAEAMRQAAELAPENGSQAMRAALAYSEAQRPAEAEHWLREAVRREPTRDRAWYNLGLLLAHRQDLGEAVRMLERAQVLRPNNAAYSYALATVLIQQGDTKRAREYAEGILRYDPHHEGAREIMSRSKR